MEMVFSNKISTKGIRLRDKVAQHQKCHHAKILSRPAGNCTITDQTHQSNNLNLWHPPPSRADTVVGLRSGVGYGLERRAFSLARPHLPDWAAKLAAAMAKCNTAEQKLEAEFQKDPNSETNNALSSYSRPFIRTCC